MLSRFPRLGPVRPALLSYWQSPRRFEVSIRMKHKVSRKRPTQRQRINDPKGTKRNIVDVATQEFARKGFSGAEIDKLRAAGALG